jgi:protein TonB
MAFESFLTQEKQKPKRGRRITYLVSLLLHGALLVVGVIYSFWHVDELSPPNVQVTFMMAQTPPPPPPPPPKKKNTPKVVTKPTVITQPRANQIVQPKEVPKEEEEDDGQEGGVEGGVAGGVVGSVPSEAPAGPPRFLPPNVARGNLLIDPQADAYRVKLPPALSKAGMILWAMVKLCANKEGHVDDVKIIKGADPTVDPNIISTLKTWRFKPAVVDGRPVPFCTTYRYEIAAR